LVNGIGVWIHHAGNSTRFCPVAFIFDECTGGMVIRWCAALRAQSDGNAGLLSGPRMEGDVHASQDDIDAMFN
jgi:hypothetical protein